MALLSLFLVTWAQHPLVTLSHDGELSFFSTQSAFQEALDSAKNGDIIFLSEGKFTANLGDITIKTRVSIVGCGYNSHILSNIMIDMGNNPNSYIDAPLFDGVRLQKLDFSGDTSRDNLEKVEIKRCWIRELENGGYAGLDFTIDKCYIESAEFFAVASNNTFVRNSKIGEIKEPNGGYIQLQNCNVGKAYYCPRVVLNSIIEASTYPGTNSYLMATSGGTHTVYNSLFSYKNLTGHSRVITYDCYYDAGEGEGGLLDDKVECTLDLLEKDYLSEDGVTPVGIHGGESPFSENPSVPTVDSEKSSVEYDADSNKLKVTITVKPN